jgi:hypothetical protein
LPNGPPVALRLAMRLTRAQLDERSSGCSARRRRARRRRLMRIDLSQHSSLGSNGHSASRVRIPSSSEIATQLPESRSAALWAVETRGGVFGVPYRVGTSATGPLDA